MHIICFGQQNWDYCWTGKQQLMSRLAARGHHVLYVDPTWAGTGEIPAAAGGLRHEGPGQLHVFTYRYRPLFRWRVNRWRWPRAVDRAARELGFRDPVAIALRPPALPLLEALDPRGRVYYAVDEMTAFGDRTPADKRAVRLEEEAMLRGVDVALGVSRRLQARFATVHSRTRFLPNGADVDHFGPQALATAPAHPGLTTSWAGPTLVFIGQVDERLDQALLLALAAALPDARIVLAGRVKPGVDVSRLEAEPRIRLLGYVPYDELPGVLQSADVCLVPYRINELTRSCNPLKVFEYLATARPVVATDLDGLAWCADVIEIAVDHDAFVAAVRGVLKHPARGRDARLERARENGWDARVDELEAILAQARSIDAARRARRAAPTDPRYVGSDFGGAGGAMFYGSRLAGRLFGLLRGLRDMLPGRRPGPRRVLVARRTRLGDMVVFLPTLHALRARFPDARIELAVQPGAEHMVRWVTGDDGPVDAVRTLAFLSATTRAERLRGAVRLLADGYDLLVTGAAYATLAEAWLCGAPRWVGLDEGHPLQRRIPRRVSLDPFRHEAENHLAVAEALGAVVVGPARSPRMPPSEQAAVQAARRLLGLPATAEVVVIHPGAQKPSRRWPAARFAALAAALLTDAPARRIVVTGSSEEDGLAESVRTGVPPELRTRCVVAAGRTDLETLRALLSGAELVVCGDTGVVHLARALGAPLLAVLGPENEERWGPHPGGYAPAASVRHVVPCAPCKRWDCAPHYCLESLTASEATAAALDILAGRATEPAAFPAWARGYGEGIGDGERRAPAGRAAPPEDSSVELYGVDRRSQARDWQRLEGLAAPPPTVLVLTASGAAPAAAEAASDYPRPRFAALADLRDEMRDEYAVAVLREPGRWPVGRLSAEVAALVRRPDLAVAGIGGDGRNPGNALPADVASTGATFRGTVIRELLEGRPASGLVTSEEYAVLRTVWRALSADGAPNATAAERRS